MLTNWVDFGMGLQEALDAPRCFYENGVVVAERGYPGAVSEELRMRGHGIKVPKEPLGSAQAIRIHYARAFWKALLIRARTAAPLDTDIGLAEVPGHAT